jgi:uncharacterized protein (TIGR03067 family)
MRTIAALLVTLALPAGEPAGDSKDIQGTWRIVLLMDSGENVPVNRDNRVIITEDRLRLRDKMYPLDSTFRLDGSKNPKWIDLGTPPARYPGIYELNGDVLKICFNERPRGERPTVFGSMKDSPSDVLLVLQRDRR